MFVVQTPEVLTSMINPQALKTAQHTEHFGPQHARGIFILYSHSTISKNANKLKTLRHALRQSSNDARV